MYFLFWLEEIKLNNNVLIFVYFLMFMNYNIIVCRFDNENVYFVWYIRIFFLGL